MRLWGEPNAANGGQRLSGVPMPRIDKPTGRVVALIVLLITVAPPCADTFRLTTAGHSRRRVAVARR